EDLALAGSPFTLNESPGDASGGIGVFAVVNCKREEVNAFPWFRIGTGGGENDVVADAHNAGAVRLLRQLSGFKVNRLATLQLDTDFVLHLLSPFRSEHNR